MHKLIVSLFSAAAIVGVLATTGGSAEAQKVPALRKAFPNLTTIYIIPGVRDNGGAANVGTATILQCANTSGGTVSLRVLALGPSGTVRGDVTQNLGHGASVTFATHAVNSYSETNLNTGSMGQGVFNVESTHPSVFCTASTIGAANSVPAGNTLHAVRVNSQPGTMELRASLQSATAPEAEPRVEREGALKLTAAARRKAFPNLTTIYVVPGVRDDGGANETGLATSVHCSNVSGSTVTLRVLALFSTGAVGADQSTTLVNGASRTFSTHYTAGYIEDVSLDTGSIVTGVFNIEATSPAVFCSAAVHNAGDIVPIGINLHMIRVNALPGTQE